MRQAQKHDSDKRVSLLSGEKPAKQVIVNLIYLDSFQIRFSAIQSLIKMYPY